MSTTPTHWNAAEPDFDAARKWHALNGQRPLPSNIGEVSYARSSGPGGQNVNKWGALDTTFAVQLLTVAE